MKKQFLTILIVGTGFTGACSDELLESAGVKEKTELEKISILFSGDAIESLDTIETSCVKLTAKIEPKLSESLTLTLTSVSGAMYADAECTTVTTALSIEEDTETVDFYYRNQGTTDENIMVSAGDKSATVAVGAKYLIEGEWKSECTLKNTDGTASTLYWERSEFTLGENTWTLNSATYSDEGCTSLATGDAAEADVSGGEGSRSSFLLGDDIGDGVRELTFTAAEKDEGVIQDTDYSLKFLAKVTELKLVLVGGNRENYGPATNPGVFPSIYTEIDSEEGPSVDVYFR